jgi:hypothetical protein
MKPNAMPIDNPQRYTLTMSEAQARLTAEALELLMRWCIGQLQAPSVVEFRKTADEYRQKQGLDKWGPYDTRELFDKLRAQLFPELHGPGHSYGVGWNEQPEQQQAQIAYELYKEILYEFHKDNDYQNVHSFKPCLFYSDQPVPVFTKALPATNVEWQQRAEAAEAKLALIRATATRGVPCLINLAAIDRILGTPVAGPFPPACPVCTQQPNKCLCPPARFTPQQLMDFEKRGREPAEAQPHTIPCDQCGACYAGETCSRLS